MKFYHPFVFLGAFVGSTISAQQTYISSLSPFLNVAQTFYKEGQAYNFTTDDQSYKLSSIALSIRPLKNVINFRGSIFASSSIGSPIGSPLATVFDVADLNDLNPIPETGLKIIGFKFSTVDLAPNARYVFIAGADEDLAYEIWGNTNLVFERPSGGNWSISPINYGFVRSEWLVNTLEYFPAMAISAVAIPAVPEASTYGIWGSAVILAVILGRRRRV